MDSELSHFQATLSTYEGLISLFRFGLSIRENSKDKADIKRTEDRFSLGAYEPPMRNLLAATVLWLEDLSEEKRFEWTYVQITKAGRKDSNLEQSLIDDLVVQGHAKDIVRFSFAAAIIPCLKCARLTLELCSGTPDRFAIRYAGLDLDKQLVAFAALFLNLPLYVESNLPWDPEEIFEDGEPNNEAPDLEISFPPADFRGETSKYLLDSLKKSQLPRVVDRGKLDIESVMLLYFGRSVSSALVFVSEKFVSSTKQSYLLTRQNLLSAGRISRVTELAEIQHNGDATIRYLLEITATDDLKDAVSMVIADDFEQLKRLHIQSPDLHGKSQVVSVGDIDIAGHTLKPSRFVYQSPTSGKGIADIFKKLTTPSKYCISDLFDVIRPKTTSIDPVGTLTIREVRSGDITEFGELASSFRELKVRGTLSGGLENQEIRKGDILLAHRGPIGRIAYVNETPKEGSERWASQSLLIIRKPKSNSKKAKRAYCDPRVLFMYLSTPKIRDWWPKLAIGDRSPAIPIGEIERFGLPEHILLKKRPKVADMTVAGRRSEIRTEKILHEFDERQEHILQLRELETKMNLALEVVWDTAWEDDSN